MERVFHVKNYYQCSSCGDVFTIQSVYGQFPSVSPCCADTKFQVLSKEDLLQMKEQESVELQKQLNEILV